jgi:hypothetical protein
MLQSVGKRLYRSIFRKFHDLTRHFASISTSCVMYLVMEGTMSLWVSLLTAKKKTIKWDESKPPCLSSPESTVSEIHRNGSIKCTPQMANQNHQDSPATSNILTLTIHRYIYRITKTPSEEEQSFFQSSSNTKQCFRDNSAATVRYITFRYGRTQTIVLASLSIPFDTPIGSKKRDRPLVPGVMEPTSRSSSGALPVQHTQKGWHGT